MFRKQKMKGSDTMMEITDKNRQEVVTSLVARGYDKLKLHVETHLKINDTEYPKNSDWGTDKNYGVKLFLIKTVKECVEVKQAFNLMEECPECEEVIIEDDKRVSLFVLYLTGDESGVCLYFVESL